MRKTFLPIIGVLLIIGACASEASNEVATTSTVEVVSTTSTLAETTTSMTINELTMATSFRVLDERDWKLLNKNPNAQAGEGVQLWGTIIQFDVRTGPNTFKALVYRDKASRDLDYSLSDYTIADISGESELMAEWLADDQFSCECTIVGVEEYTTENMETRLTIIMNANSLTRG